MGSDVYALGKIKDVVGSLSAWLSPLIGVLGFIFEKLQLDILMKVFYLLSIYLLFLGIIEMRHKRKIRKLENKQKIITPKAQKTTNLALDTEKQAEQLLNNVDYYRKVGTKMLDKIKKIFLWIWKFKEQLVSLIGILVVEGIAIYCTVQDYALELMRRINPNFNVEPIWFKVVVVVVFTLVMALTIRNVCKKVGLGGLQYALEVEQEKLDTKVSKNKLSENTIKTLKKIIKITKEEIIKIKSALAQKEKELATMQDEIKSIQELIPLGVKNDNDLSNAVVQFQKTQNEIVVSKANLENLETKLVSYEEQLK